MYYHGNEGVTIITEGDYHTNTHHLSIAKPIPTAHGINEPMDIIEYFRNNSPSKREFCQFIKKYYHNISAAVAIKTYRRLCNEQIDFEGNNEIPIGSEFCHPLKNKQNISYRYTSISNNISTLSSGNDVNKIKNVINNNHQQIINETKWENIPIFNKKSNEKRFTLCLTKKTFKMELNRCISNKNENTVNSIIPIIMFDVDGGYHMEYVQIVKICNNYIGISYIYNQQIKMVEIAGIHANKSFIQQQHQLVSGEHECHCLINFIFNIDHLQIANSEDENNQLMHYKNRYEKLTKFIKSSVEDIKMTQSNQVDITKQYLQEWIERAKKISKNSGNQ